MSIKTLDIIWFGKLSSNANNSFPFIKRLPNPETLNTNMKFFYTALILPALLAVSTNGAVAVRDEEIEKISFPDDSKDVESSDFEEYKRND